MASTSASLVEKSFKYDVFLSFRGEDTRKSFVDHLYHALEQKSIITYKDDEKIQKGKMISDQLLRSIEESRIHIIVFSKNYASSSWCLDELVKIIECQKTKELTAYPIFFDVEPTEVRNQSGAVGEAFARHVEKEKARRWRDAMKVAADLAGRELKNTFDGHEAKFIQIIVQDISLELRSINPSADGKLIGMETRVKDVLSYLETGFDEVQMIGVKGIGGGGKTTLARAVFDHMSNWFDGKSFVENVREVSKDSPFGLKRLQERVLKDVLNEKNIDVPSVADGKHMMKKGMCSRKVLVVLDDVDDIEQLEALACERNWFKAGSRIIITTRDKQLLVSHQVNFIHDVNLLTNEEAIRLFSRYAFGRETPVQGYEELSEKVVRYAAGLPLTIKVLGSSLCGSTEHEWHDVLERLKTIPEEQTLKRLELSYNALENDQKEIFLDIACILKGHRKKYAIKALESCGLRAQVGLKVLEQKSLVTISKYDVLLLHDLIEEMGMNIVRREHLEEPNRHNRLWIKKEIEHILVNDLGTKAIRSVNLVDTDLYPAIIMKGFRKMKELRFLYLDARSVDEDSELETDQVNQYLPNTLQYLHWSCYPFRYLPKTFQANKLVCLEMHSSKISELWEGGERKVLNKLRFLNLKRSKLRTLDLGMTPCLEELDLFECRHFVEIKMPFECPKLKILNLSHSKVGNINLGMTPSLENLYLAKCTDFVEPHIPVELPKLKFLTLSNSKMSSLNLELIPNLEHLNLSDCISFVELHMPVECPKLKVLSLSCSKVSNLNLRMTPSLEKLNLEWCDDFVELHMPDECPKLKILNLGYVKVSNLNLGMTPSLEELNLEGCVDLVELHMPNECLKLKVLKLIGSKISSLTLGPIPSLETLDLGDCKSFVELYLPVECPKLKFLNLGYSKVSNLNLGMTPSLKELNLEWCEDFVELHMSNECPKLKVLKLSGSKIRSLTLGPIPSLETLDLRVCKSFVELHMPVECPKLRHLNLSGSKVSKHNLLLTPNLESLYLKECYCLQEIHAPEGCLENLVNINLSSCLGCEYFLFNRAHQLFGGYHVRWLTKLNLTADSLDKCPLDPNSNLPKLKFICEYDEPRRWSGNLEKLISFGVCVCTNLESFSASICSLQHITELTLEGSITEVPEDIWQLESLEMLSLSLKEIKHLSDNICMLKHLRYLILKSCWLLEKLPMDLGRLQCLEELDLTDCVMLQDIPYSICNMIRLECLLLPNCIRVEKLPEDLGNLECLEEFELEGAGITNLPDSICMLKYLRYLKLKSCWLLEQLPMDLGRLQCLEKLDLTNCVMLRDIPSSICNMIYLKYLLLPNCILVEKLPEDLGNLKRLEELNIEGAGITHLPLSTFRLTWLRIIWSKRRLEFYDFTSLTEISRDTASSYVYSTILSQWFRD